MRGGDKEFSKLDTLHSNPYLAKKVKNQILYVISGEAPINLLTRSPKIPLELKHKKIPFSISALAETGFVLYSSSPFHGVPNSFWNQILEEK